MTASRYRAQAAIRRVLARHWIDLDRIRFGEFRGVVRLTGELRFVDARGDRPSIGVLETIRAEILRIAEVRVVAFELDNWVRGDEGRWEQVDRRAAGNEAQPAGGVFEVVARGEQEESP